jgi:hypothetical protein
MEPETQSPATDVSPPAKVRRWRVALIALGLLLIAIFAFLSLNPAPGLGLVWLSGRVIQPPRKATTWSKVRFQMIRFTYPVWRRFRKPATTLRVEAVLLKLPSAAAADAVRNLPQPISTNAQGFRAWILSPEQLVSARHMLLNPAATLAAPRLITASGSPAQMAVGGKDASIFRFDFNPKVAGKAIRLGLGGEWVEGADSTATNSFICRVLLPNGGALVVEGAGAKTNTGDRFLLNFTATAIDARGNPLKL